MSENEFVELKKLWKVGLPLILATTIVNIIIFYIADELDAFPEDVLVANTDEPMSVTPVIFSSVMYLVGALIGFAILINFTNLSLTTIQKIAVGVVVLTFAIPFTIEDAPNKMILSLNLMHIAAGAITIPGLTSRYLWDKM
ncbi:MAG: DUF6069 family protein [Candidatus Kariarchaeaceae archaeon]|jgi:hypothetical protein